jgi:beta-lactam-binding protein with PASTA domain
MVLRQDPEPNSKVKHNRTVYLYVTGLVPPQVIMPRLVDRSERQARLIIETYGLKFGKVELKQADCNGCVLAAVVNGKEITPGTSLKKGSVVSIVVGSKDPVGNHADSTTVTPGDAP